MKNDTITTNIPYEIQRLTHQIKCLNFVLQEGNRLKRIELEANGVNFSEEDPWTTPD